MQKAKSCGGIILNNNKVVLVHQRGHSWAFPRGKKEQGETDIEAAKREIYEETGLTDLELITDLGEYERESLVKKEMRKYHLFLFTTKEIYLEPQEKNTTNAKWVDIDKVSNEITHPKDSEFLEKKMKEFPELFGQV